MNALIALYLSVSSTFNLPPGLLSAVCFTESKHTIQAIHHDDGNADSIGVCQIQLPTARLMGFRGSAKSLRDPATNVYWAGAYLAYQLERYDGDTKKAVAAYNAGTHRVNRKGLTMNRKYVGKVMQAWNEGR